MEENNKNAFEVLTKINNLLDEVRDLFPPSNQTRNPAIKMKPINNEIYSFKTLKRVKEIIKDFNEESSERKLKNLLAFLSNPNMVAFLKRKDNQI